ncbi:MAG TPA: hypothetical protein VGM90_04105 [Kofleriaceae bacterium]|jgi:outer membrane protein assembly factor BamB
MDASSVGSMPVAVHATGNGALVIGTDDGEWLMLAKPGEQLASLPSTGPVSDAVVAIDGTLYVACWEPRLEQLRDGAWREVPLETPATALAATPTGLVIADIGGGLSVLANDADLTIAPRQILSSQEPLVSLVSLAGGVVGLGASGSVEITAWPGEPDDPLEAIHTGTIGRAHAIFAGMAEGTAMIAGARGLGILDAENRRLIAVTTELGERIAGGIPFADRRRAFVYGDDGGGWIVDELLSRQVRVNLGAAVSGAAAHGDGTVLAWTADGALHSISHDGSSYRIVDGDVVLAAPELARVDTATIAIHWSRSTGTRVTRGHVPWN